jgi:hypothetical protein
MVFWAGIIIFMDVPESHEDELGTMTKVRAHIMRERCDTLIELCSFGWWNYALCGKYSCGFRIQWRSLFFHGG